MAEHSPQILASEEKATTRTRRHRSLVSRPIRSQICTGNVYCVFVFPDRRSMSVLPLITFLKSFNFSLSKTKETKSYAVEWGGKGVGG